MHGGQVPDIADDGPGRHHQEDVVEHAVLGAVPESLSKLDIVLDGDRPNGSANLKGAFLELHDAGVVDAGPLGEDEDGQLVRVLNVFLQSARTIIKAGDIRPVKLSRLAFAGNPG